MRREKPVRYFRTCVGWAALNPNVTAPAHLMARGGKPRFRVALYSDQWEAVTTFGWKSEQDIEAEQYIAVPELAVPRLVWECLREALGFVPTSLPREGEVA